MSATLLLASPLAAWMVVVQPLVGLRRYRRLAGGAAIGRPGFYRRCAARQWWLAGGVLVGALGTRTRLSDLGLVQAGRPQAVLLAGLVDSMAVGGLLVVALRWQRRHWPEGSLSEWMLRPVAALLPRSREDRRAFAVLAVSAGATEELLYRGFLTAYLAALVPGVGFAGALALSTVVFAVAHAYQGVPGVALTAVMGAALATLYAASGSLLLPATVHALVDLRVLLLLPRVASDEVVRAGPARSSSPAGVSRRR